MKKSNKIVKQGLFSEPLVQFLLLGLLIFSVDSYITSKTENPLKIHVDDKKINELITIFEEGQGRTPSTREIENLIVQWTQNEIMFREGQLLDLHKGDEMIRSRLILKMRNILLNNIVVEIPTDEQLMSWYERYKENYRTPEILSLEWAPVDGGEADALLLAEELNQADFQTLPIPVRTYKNRPLASLTAFADPATINQLITAAYNRWTIIQSPQQKWRVVRVSDYRSGSIPEFVAIKNKLVKDWQKFSREQQLNAQTKAIIERYTIVIDPGEEFLDKYDINYLSSNPGQES